MEVSIHSNIKAKIPNFKIGIIHYKHISVGASPQMLKGRLRLFQESLFFDLETKSPSEIEGVSEWRKIFKELGTDPSKYRPSAEALFRRIQKQTYLPSINSAVDLNNFFSLQYEVPIGIYDCQFLQGDIKIAIGKENDYYKALNERNISLKNKIISSDQDGPFGSPYVDSQRAPATEQTKEAIQIVYLRPSLPIEQAEKLTKSLKDMFLQLHGGEATFFVNA
ncbi:B3/B4 domain-containing protein [Priestia abyssalis]|uniref:B3/B4 domain-containing protein n=1 Tax=Priestia abyssalis TaxID=1221450 RepID=UPI000994A788|nr:phenylalanine--tRNA ligase beta subunit-related protein [Priestia abyssalis]